MCELDNTWLHRRTVHRLGSNNILKPGQHPRMLWQQMKRDTLPIHFHGDATRNSVVIYNLHSRISSTLMNEAWSTSPSRLYQLHVWAAHLTKWPLYTGLTVLYISIGAHVASFGWGRPKILQIFRIISLTTEVWYCYGYTERNKDKARLQWRICMHPV